MIRCRSLRPPDLELRTRLRDLANQRRRFGYRRLFILLREQGEPSGVNRIYRLYREEGLTVRKRKARRRAVGTRTPILVEAKVNARWSLDFVHDQFALGRRFRILNIVDDVTRECLAAIPDTSISGKRVARELTALIDARGKPGMIVSDTHYEVLKSEERRFALFQKTRKLAVILDEAHKIKNPEAEITKTFHKLAPGFVRRVIMTGTPVANRPYDIWSPVKFLDGGKSLGLDFSEFRENLDLTNELADDVSAQQALEGGLATIFSKIHRFTVRETKGSAGIELPEKHIENVPVQLEAAQLALYDRFRTELGAEVLREGKLVTDDAEEILKRLLRLVQVASNPLLVDESYKGEPGKLPATRRLVDRAVADGSKIILWTNFIANADWLGRQFKDAGSVVVHGSKAIADRNAALDKFKTDPEIRVLVATPASAKEGLTLTVANHAVFFDRSFSLDDYLQAQDRIHRISQTRECHIWNLIAAGTVDDWVDMLLAAKHLAAQLAQGDIDREEYRERANYDFGRVVRGILKAGEDHDGA